jgi:hypothetical protein
LTEKGQKSACGITLKQHFGTSFLDAFLSAFFDHFLRITFDQFLDHFRAVPADRIVGLASWCLLKYPTTEER